MDMIRKIFNWIFKVELYKLNVEINKAKRVSEELIKQKKVLDSLLENIDVSVDVHEYDHRFSPSWAVISLQGEKTDYIKFVDLGNADIRDIAGFLRKYERASNIKVDASPQATQFLRVVNRNPKNKFV